MEENKRQIEQYENEKIEKKIKKEKDRQEVKNVSIINYVHELIVFHRH
jgi:hypothetical protein